MKIVGAIFLNSYLLFLLGLALHLSHLASLSAKPSPLAAPITYPPPPEFAEISPTQARKAAFFSYFSGIIDDENNKILAQRRRLLATRAKLIQSDALGADETEMIETLSTSYGVSVVEDKNRQLDELLIRVDAVPRSLALAQAANESAWGTSRFAIDGHNYFGQWCFTRGCGLVPHNRRADAVHEVRLFSSPADSVKAYLHNINTHRAYAELRTIRAQASAAKIHPSGSLLANGLLNYSERGAEYVREIKAMIAVNGLETTEEGQQLGTR